MATMNLKGNPVNLSGTLPAVGATAPEFTVVNASLEDVTLANFAGKKKILNITPSLDLGVCATSVKTFNEKIASRSDAVVLTITKDLPFAQKRFCETEGIKNVVALSAFRSSFGKDYGIEMTSGGFSGLLGRSIVVLDENNKVLYTQITSDIVEEPDYEKALAALG